MWEEWRRSRRAVVVIAIVLLVFTVAVYAAEDREKLWPLGALSCYTVFGLIIYLLLAQSTRSSIDAGIPARRFRLPASSFELVLWPFLYRLGVTTLGAVLAAVICRLIRADNPLIAPVFFFWLILSVFHTLAIASALIGGVLVVVLGGLMFFPGVMVFGTAYQSPAWRYPAFDLAGMAAAALSALILTTAVLGKVRTGGFSFGLRRVFGVVREAGLTAGGAAEKKPFFSAAAAQRWFEWRCTGKTVFVLMATLTLAFLLSEGYSNVFDAESSYTVDFWLGFIIFLTNSAAAGLWAFGDQAARTRRSYSMFVQTRPVTDLRLARGKFEAAAMAIALNLFLVVMVLAAMSVVVGAVKYREDWAQVFRVEWEWRHLLLLPMSLGLAWIAYWRGVVMAGFFIALAIYTEAAPNHFARWVYNNGVFTPVALACIAAACAVLAPPFLQAYWRKALQGPAMAAIGAGWAAVTALSGFLFLRYAYPDFQVSGALLGSALLVLLALSPLAIVPVRIARGRHA